MQHIEQLKRQFAVPGRVDFSVMDGMVILHTNNDVANAAIAMQGAQLLDYQLHEEALIWLSDDALLAPGKSIRGGIPVCWPWFGAHPADTSLPAHGFARTSPWRLLRVDTTNESLTELEFALHHDTRTRGMMAQPLALRLTLRIGNALDISLETTHLGEAPYRLTEALHTYFLVGDVEKVSVHGLAGRDYLDKVTGFDRKHQTGGVRIVGEVDRIYLDTDGHSEIRDPLLKRRIRLTARNSRSTVVWNPGAEKARQMGDLGPEGHRRMLCVETANAAENGLELQPGQVHSMGLRIERRPF